MGRRLLFAGAVFLLCLAPAVSYSVLVGDINNDGKIGLEESIYSMRASAGLVDPMSNPGAIWGEWYVKSTSKVTFNPDNTYDMGRLCGGLYPASERGVYTYDPQTGAFHAEVTEDSNGDYGFGSGAGATLDATVEAIDYQTMKMLLPYGEEAVFSRLDPGYPIAGVYDDFSDGELDETLWEWGSGDGSETGYYFTEANGRLTLACTDLDGMYLNPNARGYLSMSAKMAISEVNGNSWLEMGGSFFTETITTFDTRIYAQAGIQTESNSTTDNMDSTATLRAGVYRSFPYAQLHKVDAPISGKDEWHTLKITIEQELDGGQPTGAHYVRFYLNGALWSEKYMSTDYALRPCDSSTRDQYVTWGCDGIPTEGGSPQVVYRIDDYILGE
ncbi:hypothetical protein [Desulfatibacillum aliphaticivorans]|uniref:hypothetical protein n=1 Tax=Desulfatibacillum aliphaticivorans TaxID=218208 RepID=UPI00048280FC|nr:hypothetical protein [Desulfatibacillum aliphaticivorans]